MTGLIDNVLAAATVDADGCIGGPPNFCPVSHTLSGQLLALGDAFSLADLALSPCKYASARLWQLSQMPLRGASLEEAKRLQGAIARADSVVFEAGVNLLIFPLDWGGADERLPGSCPQADLASTVRLSSLHAKACTNDGRQEWRGCGSASGGDLDD